MNNEKMKQIRQRTANELKKKKAALTIPLPNEVRRIEGSDQITAKKTALAKRNGLDNENEYKHDKNGK